MVSADVRVFFALYGGMGGKWAPLMVVVTVLGGGWGFLALVPILWRAATRRFAVALAVAIGAQGMLVWAMKLAVGRVRPWIAFGLPPPIDAPHDGSFPSGHASGCFCVVGFLAVALPAMWPAQPAKARWVVGAAALMAVLVAFSRVYLGAHFVSDAVGGAALGGMIGVAGGVAYVGTGT